MPLCYLKFIQHQNSDRKIESLRKRESKYIKTPTVRSWVLDLLTNQAILSIKATEAYTTICKNKAEWYIMSLSVANDRNDMEKRWFDMLIN